MGAEMGYRGLIAPGARSVSQRLVRSMIWKTDVAAMHMRRNNILVFKFSPFRKTVVRNEKNTREFAHWIPAEEKPLIFFVTGSKRFEP